MTITDVQPRTFMCPLPKGYWWEVEISQRNNCVFLRLMKRRNIAFVKFSCAVLDFSTKTTDQAVIEIINRSYAMWQEFFRTSHNKNDEWQARADELRSRLAHPGVKIKVRVEKIK